MNKQDDPHRPPEHTTHKEYSDSAWGVMWKEWAEHLEAELNYREKHIKLANNQRHDVEAKYEKLLESHQAVNDTIDRMVKHRDRLEADLKAKDEHIAHVDHKCQTDLDNYLAKIIKLETEIERLKAGAMDCAYCGKSFVPPHDGFLYCSDECTEADTDRIRMGKPSAKEFKPLYYIDGDGEPQLCSKQSSVEKSDKGEE